MDRKVISRDIGADASRREPLNAGAVRLFQKEPLARPVWRWRAERGPRLAHGCGQAMLTADNVSV
jgi:hypothetical protein